VSNHVELPVSPWVRRWSHLVAPGASVLDVACGPGRHVRWFAKAGCRVTGVDRDAAALEALREVAHVIVADIEGGPWPLADRRFDAVIVTNYLWRALLPTLVASVAPGGVLIYETFAQGHASVGKPSNPDFLLRPGELLGAVTGLRVVAFEDGFVTPPDRYVQRIVAVREPEASAAAAPPRYRLDGQARGEADSGAP
jgi:SAM-dependent methyltransferase